jgi:ribosomal protein S18 acetylase RimI-like enzyme
MIEIHPANFPNDILLVQGLFREYADGLGVDLCFQGFEEELSTLPGKYQPPNGQLLIASGPDDAAGCVAMRPIDAQTCEMKRLYVRPQARGENIGRRLVERIIDDARRAGYARICLDTLPSMTTAQSLYRSLGFVATEPYVFNPIAGTIFMALNLDNDNRSRTLDSDSSRDT